MPAALGDITVLDLGQVIGMPFCTMLLADMGARVIKIESRDRAVERMALGIKRQRNGKTERVHAAQYRDRKGKARHTDIALLDSMPVALANLGARYTIGGELRTRAGNVSFGGSSSGVYPTIDGHVAIAASTSDAVWRRFAKVIGRP